MSVLFLALATFLGAAVANVYFLLFLWDSKMDTRSIALALIRASYTGETVADALGSAIESLPSSTVHQLSRLTVEKKA